MNLKAMMFAGLGLFIAMTATAIWVGNDMAAIKERERAKRAAECAALAAVPAQDAGAAVAPVTGAPTAAGATTPAPTNCASPGTGTEPGPGTGAGPAAVPTGSGEAALEPGIDPTTGLPLEGTAQPSTGDPGITDSDLSVAPTEQPLADDGSSSVSEPGAQSTAGF